MGYKKRAIPLLFILSLCMLLSGCGIINYFKGAELVDETLIERLKGHAYYERLSEEEQRLYNLMYECISTRKDSVELGGANKDTVKKVHEVIRREHPELFYGCLSYKYGYLFDEGRVRTFEPVYTLTEKEYRNMLSEVEESTKGIIEKAKKVKDEQGEYEAELLIHDWIIDTTEYFNDDNQKIGKGYASFRTITGVFLEGKANCMGYASAFTYLLQKVGIRSVNVTGKATNSKGATEPHEWNLVEIDGKWYHVDVCWDDPTSEDDARPRKVHDYFNLTSKEMGITREVRNKYNLPEAKSEDSNYHIREKIQLKDLEQAYKLISTKLKGMVENGEAIEMKFEDKASYTSFIDKRKGMVRDIVKGADIANKSFTYYTMKDDRLWTVYMYV